MLQLVSELVTPTGSLEQRPRPPSYSHPKRPFLLSLRHGSSISFPFLGLSCCFWVGPFLNSHARKHIVPIVHFRVSFTFKRVGLCPDWNKMFMPHVLWGSCDTFPQPSGPTGAPGATSPPQALGSWERGLAAARSHHGASFGLLSIH